MSEIKEKRNGLLGEKLIKNMEKRGFEAYYVKTREAALEKALELIPGGAKIGYGGSATLDEIGLKQVVCQGEYQVVDRDKAKDPEEKRRLELEALDTDYFLCGTNAIAETGELVNIDGNGNRLAGIIYGPRNVLIVAGMNKVVKTLDEAISRAQNIAAPINNQRFELQNPCHGDGACHLCFSPESICCQYLVTRMSLKKQRIKVILVDDNLGY